MRVVVQKTMQSFLIFSLILTIYGISSINSEELSDVQLKALYEKRVNMEEFVSNIFDLPASEQLYVYEYLEDLIKNLEEDPRSAKFFASALQLLQQKTDDFNTQHKLQKVPVKQFLQKRINVMNKTASKNSEEKTAKKSSTNSGLKTKTGTKSNPKDVKILPSKSETKNNPNESSTMNASDISDLNNPSSNLNVPQPEKIITQSELKPTRPIVKPVLLAKKVPTPSAKVISIIKVPYFPNSKEIEQQLQTPSPTNFVIPRKLAKLESNTLITSSLTSEPAENSSPPLKQSATKALTTPPSSSNSHPESLSEPVKKSPQSANETAPKSRSPKPTSNAKKSRRKSDLKSARKPSSPATKETSSKAAQLNSQQPSQKMRTLLPPPVNQSNSKKPQREIKASKPGKKNETSKAKSITATQPQDEIDSKGKLTESDNSDESKTRQLNEPKGHLSFSV